MADADGHQVRVVICSAHMKRLPHRISLVAQTAAVLMEQIKSGRWIGWLPGEHELSTQMQVSRKTVRAALKQLLRQGVIRRSKGRRTQIVQKTHNGSRPTSNSVVMLLPGPLQSLNPLAVFLVGQLREHLTKAGYPLEIQTSRVPYRARGTDCLKSLAETLRPIGWVLFQSTEPMQRWFATRRLPCVLVGSRYEGVDLPSVDRDFAAAGQHAVNQFVARGHKRLALLTPFPAAAGDAATVEAFRAVIAQIGGDVTGIVQEHDGQVANLCARVDRLMAQSQPPTAFLVSRARHVLTVLGHLLSRGVRVPRDVALISRDDDSFLDAVVPSVARYSHSEELFASRISRAVLEAVQGEVRAKDYRIMPQFIKGRTLC